MNATVFGLALDRLGVAKESAKTYSAARMVLVDGMAPGEAASVAGIHRISIFKAIRRIEKAYTELGVCPYCGNRMPH